MTLMGFALSPSHTLAKSLGCIDEVGPQELFPYLANDSSLRLHTKVQQ